MAEQKTKPPIAALCPFRVAWSFGDDEYVATNDLYPGLSGLDEDPVRALAALMEAVGMSDDITREDSRTPRTESPL